MYKLQEEQTSNFSFYSFVMFIVYLMLFIYFLYLDIDTSMEGKYKLAANIQLQSLVEWARHIPHFNGLSIDDQVVFLKGL